MPRIGKLRIEENRDAIETLLTLREALGGNEGAAVGRLLAHYGVGDGLSRQLGSRRISRDRHPRPRSPVLIAQRLSLSKRLSRA